VDIQDDRYFWSAVGMSAIMKAAGFTRDEFPFAQSHSKFIRRFVAARNAKEASASFWAYRLSESAGKPEIGDIVAYARGKQGSPMTRTKADALFDSTASYDSHTDVVVSKTANNIQVIGCNVLDSVTKKTIRLGANGHIDDNKHFWFAVLKRRNV
jgi:hypothetical protein